MKFYLAYNDPPGYKTVGEFSSVESVEEWLNLHLDEKGFVDFPDMIKGIACDNKVRYDQWVVSDSKRDIYPLTWVEGCITVGEPV